MEAFGDADALLMNVGRQVHDDAPALARRDHAENLADGLFGVPIGSGRINGMNADVRNPAKCGFRPLAIGRPHNV